MSEYPNIFNALFSYQPGSGNTPWENFLTEALAYILKTEPCAMKAWLALMLGKPIQQFTEYTVTSQSSERLPGQARTVFPDLKITVLWEGGQQQIIYCEHKWDSPCNHEQLRNYAQLAAAEREQGHKSAVVFVGPRYDQVSTAQELVGEAIENAVYWADIYRAFNEILDPSPMLKQFLYFMLTNNLGSLGSMNPENIRMLPQLRNVIRQFSQFSNRLLNEYRWDFLPERYRNREQINGNNFPCVTNRFGRVAIEFMTNPRYTPAISIGFLYDTSDHQVEFSHPERGIDLVLRFEADPRVNPDCESIIKLLAERRQAVLEAERRQAVLEQENQKIHTKILLRGEPGNGNLWSLLIAQKCLVDVIENCTSENDQLKAIYEYCKGLITILFGDPNLEMKLNQLRPSQGKISLIEGRPRGWPHD